MKIEIKIELDKDSQGLIQTTLNKVAENIAGFVNIFEKFSVKAEDVAVKVEDVSTESEPLKDKAEPPVQNSIANNIKPETQKQEPKKSDVKKVESKKSDAKKKLGSKKSEAKKSESKVKRATAPKDKVSSKQKITATEIVLNAINKRNGGIHLEDLKKETGFTSKQVADAVYRLKKTGKIDKTDDNLYVAIK